MSKLGSASAVPANASLRRLRRVVARTATLRAQPAKAWGIALVLLAAAFLLRYALEGRLPTGFPYLTFFPAVILTTFLSGLVPGIVVATCSGLLAWYFFIPPTNSFTLTPGAGLALGFFVFIIAIDVLLIHWMHVAVERLNEGVSRAEDEAGERELLFKEMQHRVSNNLAVISSLLTTQARATGSEEAKLALRQAAARVGLISKIQRALHDPSNQSLELDPYLRAIGPDLLQANGVENVRYDVAMDPIAVPAELAVPLGLVATELISNSIEHGRRPGSESRLKVELLREPAEGPEGEAFDTLLRVSDDGPGWPENFRIDASRNLGMKIVHSLATGIGGRIELFNAPSGGAVTLLRFATPRTAEA